MDKDRVEGSAEQAKGKVKEVAAKALGDQKLKTEGKADQVKGKVQNAVGGLKDALSGRWERERSSMGLLAALLPLLLHRLALVPEGPHGGHAGDAIR